MILLFMLISFGCLQSGTANRPYSANENIFSYTKETESVIRVFSYNIRGDTPIDRECENSWDVRKYKIKSLINYYQTDILGIQEVSAHYIEDLQELFPEYSIIAFDIYNGYKDVALLFRTDRFSAEDSPQYFWLSEEPSAPRPAWDARAPRIALYQKLYDKITDKKFFIFCTHFDSTGTQARIKSAALLAERQAILAQEIPVLILGDFNLISARQGEEVYQKLFSLHDLFDIRDCSVHGHYGPDGTWIGWSYDSVAASPGTVGDRLDQMLVRNCTVIGEGVLNAKIDNGVLITPENPDYKLLPYPSDHLPIVADIIF